MSSDNIDRFEDVTVSNSITNSISTTYNDLDSPYTLLEWITNTSNNLGNADDHINDYHDYIRTWRKDKSLSESQAKTTIRDVYIRFLKEVVVNYTTNEERRFLQNIDFTNKAEVDASAPFFAKRIREIIQFIHKNRQLSKFQKTKYSLKGSAKGLEKIIFDTIVRFVTGEDITSTRQYVLPSISAVVNSTRITFTETYDLSEDYSDTNYLYTEGVEFLLPTGDVYTGYYHIHETGTGSYIYMIGKEHTSATHDTLTRIDYRIPLKAQAANTRYGGSNIVTPNIDQGGSY